LSSCSFSCFSYSTTACAEQYHTGS
jgi:hypothetical protein